MGGHQVRSHGSGDDGYDEEGFDESQRAEILEATRSGPGNGTVMTDLDPDLGEMTDDEGDEADEIEMVSTTVGDTDRSVEMTADDIEEDDIQAEFDDDSVADDELDDADDEALKP